MKTVTGLVTILIVLLCGMLCCLCLLLFGLGIGASFFSITDVDTNGPDVAITVEPFERPEEPTPTLVAPFPDPRPEASSVSTATLATLENTIIPESDLRELAQRLEGKEDIPKTVDPPEAPRQVGETENFWITNVDTSESTQIEATLRYATEHVYFWIENGVRYDEDDLKDLVETFEHEIYPTTREFFGSEWTPGVDGDPHLYILYARRLGRSIAGYYSSADQYHPLAHEYSNAHEMFFLSADNNFLHSSFTYSVLAHEFQHMIHWYRDRNEEIWINEGFSELAILLNGYDVGQSDFVYVQNPDLQLTDWPENGDTTPHYGAAVLFLTYFLNRYGESATQALVAEPENGMSGVDNVLSMLGQTDHRRGTIPNADDLFQDWTLATYIQDSSVADGRYTYVNYPRAPQPDATETMHKCPVEDQTRDVHQYGVDYIRITCPGEYTLRFEGALHVPIAPVDPYSGEFSYWSNRGDASDTTLTRQFDFTDQQGTLTFTYWTWYDIEEDYDYAYLLASTDNESWQILTTPSGTADDPTGNSYGWAYNGRSSSAGQWIQESVDISEYAGSQLYLRFEYITDGAVTGNGIWVDDIAIPETGYFEDFESDDGGWEAKGWVRIDNVLPQAFRLALITHQGTTTAVNYLPLAEGNTMEIALNIGEDAGEVVLVVSGTTRFTRQKALYRFEIVP